MDGCDPASPRVLHCHRNPGVPWEGPRGLRSEDDCCLCRGTVQ